MTPYRTGQCDDPSHFEGRRWLVRCARWFGRIRRIVKRDDGRRLLFLDDDPGRARRFLRDHPRAVWVTTVPECLEQLSNSWDEVHLDHDLGGKVFVDSADADCGMEVIRWLCNEPRTHLKDVPFFVHTHNTTAGLLMVLQMQRGGYRAEFRPFGMDLEKILAHNEPRPRGFRARWSALVAAMSGWLRWARKGRNASSSLDCQPTLPGSSAEIQPPPSTKSS